MLDRSHSLASTAAFEEVPAMSACTIGRYGRYWQVLDPTGDLVCVTVYKRGAEEVARRLGARSRRAVASTAREPGRVTIAGQYPREGRRRVGR